MIIMLMSLIIVWLLSVGLGFISGCYFIREKHSEKGKFKTIKKTEPTDEEIYMRDKKKREEENFWNYDGTEQDTN